LYDSQRLIFFVIGGNNNKEEGKTTADLTPYKNEVKGYLGDYLEIADGTYKVEFINSGMIGEWGVKVKIRSIATFDKEDYGLNDGNGGSLYLDVCDQQGAPIPGFENLASDYSNDTKIAELLKVEGAEDWVTFKKFKEYGIEFLPDNAAKFSIISKKKEEKKASTSSSGSDTQSTTGSGDWDAVLDDYEDYMDSYIRLIKKANAGDMSALSEYPKMYEKAISLGEKLENAGDNLSTEQMTRLIGLQTKMMQEAAGM